MRVESFAKIGLFALNIGEHKQVNRILPVLFYVHFTILLLLNNSGLPQDHLG